MLVYHAMTATKAKNFVKNGKIAGPVKVYSTPLAVMAWALGSKYVHIYEITATTMPGQNQMYNGPFGQQWWIEGDVPASRVKPFFTGH